MKSIRTLLWPAVIVLLFLFSCLTSCRKSPDADPDKQQSANAKTAVNATASNAAPSEYITFSFPSDAIVKLHKIKITQSANTEYFSVINFAGGYAGLQQTPDNTWGTPNILISSLWDPNTASKIYSRVAYTGAGTTTSRFGGEGDGYKTINPYKWALNTWYNIALRAWKLNGELFIGTFIQNMSTGAWFHTSTLAMPERTTFLGSGTPTFIENWVGDNPAYDGSFVRKAFFKDCWNLNINNNWEKHTSRLFSANDGDQVRNGKYDLAFNSGYNANEDAYFMEHGGNVQRNAGFQGTRKLALPAQTNQGTAPTLSTGQIQSVSATYTSSSNSVVVTWVNNATKSPQFSSTVELLDPSGIVISTKTEVLPQKRSATFSTALGSGNYTARVTITDIFNQVSSPVSSAVTSTVVTGGIWYKIKNVNSGNYLAVKNNSATANAYIIEETSSTSNAQKWSIGVQQGGTYVLMNPNGLAIDIPGSIQTVGAKLVQYTMTKNTNQQWNLVSAGANKFVIQSNLSNHYVMDTSGGSTASGTQIVLNSISGTSGSPNQQWILEAQ